MAAGRALKLSTRFLYAAGKARNSTPVHIGCVLSENRCLPAYALSADGRPGLAEQDFAHQAFSPQADDEQVGAEESRAAEKRENR